MGTRRGRRWDRGGVILYQHLFHGGVHSVITTRSGESTTDFERTCVWVRLFGKNCFARFLRLRSLILSSLRFFLLVMSAKSACWALTLSPFNDSTWAILESELDQYKSLIYWSGCVETNGDSGIMHAHLSVAYNHRVPRFTLKKWLTKKLQLCPDFISEKLTWKGICIKPWYSRAWVEDYPDGEKIGHKKMPDELDFLEKGDESFKRDLSRASNPSWHDKVAALWDRDFPGKIPRTEESVAEFLNYLQYQSREIGVVARRLYKGRVREMFEFLRMRATPDRRAKVEVEGLPTIKDDGNQELKRTRCGLWVGRYAWRMEAEDCCSDGDCECHQMYAKKYTGEASAFDL